MSKPVEYDASNYILLQFFDRTANNRANVLTPVTLAEWQQGLDTGTIGFETMTAFTGGATRMWPELNEIYAIFSNGTSYQWNSRYQRWSPSASPSAFY